MIVVDGPGSVLDIVAKVVAIVGGVVTVIGGGFAMYWAIKTWRDSNAQRRADLRWRQAEQGKRLWDEIVRDPQCVVALQMIEFPGRAYVVDGTSTFINHERVTEALRDWSSNSSVDVIVRDSFDQLLYYFDRMEHHLRSGLVLFEDVESPAEYYVGLMSVDKEAYGGYVFHCRYTKVFHFLDRFPEWKDRAQIEQRIDGFIATHGNDSASSARRSKKWTKA